MNLNGRCCVWRRTGCASLEGTNTEKAACCEAKIQPTQKSQLPGQFRSHLQFHCFLISCTHHLGSVLVISAGSVQQNAIAWVAQTTNIYFPQFWGLEGPSSRCFQIQFLERALFWACRWPPSHCVLTWEKESKHAFWCLFKKGHEFHHKGPTCMTSSNPKQLPKATSAIPLYWELGCKQITFEVTQFDPRQEGIPGFKS